MSNILIKDEIDPIKRGKDCKDFCPLKDGTKTGDPKYCDLSFACKQIGYRSDWVQIIDWKTDEVKDHDYLCTGMLIIDKDEKSIDEEAN